MAKFSVEGIFDFDSLLRAEAMPDAMLIAAADVAVKAQKQTAKSMLRGEYATGQLAESISKSGVKRTKDGKAIQIVFKGSRVRGKRKKAITRNAEIAFVNEFGKRGQPPRPFIQTANSQCQKEVVQAMEREYGKHLDSLGF